MIKGLISKSSTNLDLGKIQGQTASERKAIT
jgi:hypothetical protein